jgi:hypothetical protein
MAHSSINTLTTNRASTSNYLTIERITALWALSEAALGGVLHAFRFPLTGLVINSSAVIFIVLIAHYAQQRGAVLRATLIVLIIKGMVSPHTPVNAYLAVSFQGILGELLFRSKKYFALSAMGLGIITLMQSGMQKLIVLTLVFGNNLWESINIFGNFILQKFNITGSPEYDISLWIILIYLMLHLITGFTIGLVAAKIPSWINNEYAHFNKSFELNNVRPPIRLKGHKKHKSWLKRPSGIAVICLAAILVVLSYSYPEINSQQGIKAIIMVIRSIFIMALWYTLIGPKLLLVFQRVLSKKRHQYVEQVQKTLQIIPPLRLIIYQTWHSTKSYKKFNRIKTFIVFALISTLSAEFYAHEPD